MNVYIDGIQVDMDAASLPAFSYRIVDVFDPGTIHGSKSTTFRIPATNAARTLAGSHSISEDPPEVERLTVSRGGQAYVDTPVRVIERSTREVQLVSIGDNAGWMKDARDLKLRDMDMGISEECRATVMENSWTDAGTLLYFPLINYGQILDTDTEATSANPDHMRPGMRLHRAVAFAFNSIGYGVKIEGRLRNDWFRLLLPNTERIQCANLDYYGAQTELGSIASLNPVQTPPLVEIPQNVTLDDDSGAIDVNFHYVAPFDQKAHASVKINLTVYETTSSGVSHLPILFWIYDGVGNYLGRVVKHVTNYTVSPQTVDFAFDTPQFDMVAGRAYRLVVDRYQGSPFEQFDVNTCRVTWTVDNIEYQENVQIENASVLPNMSLAELVKGVCTVLCVVPQTNETAREVTFKYYSDKFIDPLVDGRDMVDRMDHSTPPVKETPLLPVRLNFRWKEDEQDHDVSALNDLREDRAYGDGVHEVPGGTQDEKNIDLPFSATAMQLNAYGTLNIPVMRDHDGTTNELRFKWNPRLLFIGGMADGNWTFDGSAKTQYPYVYFTTAEDPIDGLSFEQETAYGSTYAGSFTDRWADWLRRYDRGVTLKCRLMIHDHELFGADLGVPVRIDDGESVNWCYFSEIKQHRYFMGRYTECELIPV